MYDPNPARFTSTDPIGFEAGDPNLYRYVANNPTNATDPSGMDKLTIRGDTVYWEVDKGLWNPNLLWQVGKKVGDHIEIEWGDFRVKVSEKDLAQFIRDHTVGEGDDQTRIGYLFWLYRDTIFVKPPPARPAPPKPPLPAALPQNPPRPPQDDLLPPIGQPLASGSGPRIGGHANANDALAEGAGAAAAGANFLLGLYTLGSGGAGLADVAITVSETDLSNLSAAQFLQLIGAAQAGTKVFLKSGPSTKPLTVKALEEYKKLKDGKPKPPDYTRMNAQPAGPTPGPNPGNGINGASGAASAAGKPVMPAGPMYEEVAIVGPNGKLGEFDKVYQGLFVEEKSATGISKGLQFSGKTYAQAAEDWAAANVYKKTATRINNIPKATQVIPEKGPARPVPDLAQIQNTKKFHFKIDETNPDLVNAVNKQVEQLRKDFPGYEFTVEFGK